MMYQIKQIFKIVIVLTIFSPSAYCQSSDTPLSISINFDESGNYLTEIEKNIIRQQVILNAMEVNTILVGLPKEVVIEIKIIDRDLIQVDGVTGWTLEHVSTGRIVVLLSKSFPGGVVESAKKGLKTLIYHEFHHLIRGWSINQNEYPQGIHNAIINEGLALVFAEEFTGIRHEVNAYPEEVETWVVEILSLPINANYNHWVSGYHPDGRAFIGYRTGHYVIRKAMSNTGMGIIELSKFKPKRIFEYAGYKILDSAH